MGQEEPTAKNREVLQQHEPLPDFTRASESVLKFLRGKLGFGLWMVTRTSGDDWIVLSSEDHGYGVKRGDLFRWSDSLCSRMVLGEGPTVAPRSSEIPVYAEAPIGRQVPIEAYVGVPLVDHEGKLFGTLCAIDPEPQPESLIDAKDLIELQARLLSTVLSTELRAVAEARRAERAEAEATVDGLTGLANRRGWDRALRGEEHRALRYGVPVCVLVADVDGLKERNDQRGHAAGDELIADVARVLRATCRDSDLIARTGGDEFAVLCVESDEKAGIGLVRRLELAFDQAGISVSMGLAGRHPSHGLEAAFKLADETMYACKRARMGAAS